jgi:replicative superfamily II helicase
MRIVGLFVGVDKQEDDDIRSLAFAGADAELLHAIFGDLAENSGRADVDNLLLVGDEATRDNVIRAFDQLEQACDDGDVDLVVIHFSCHGTPEGVMILADTVCGQEGATGLPHKMLGEKLESLKTKHMVVLLDCCFSGIAAGHRYFVGDGTSETKGLEALFRSMVLGNIAIAMGSRANEKGWESSRLRHGLFSFATAEALTGTAVKRIDGEISLATWLAASVSGALAQASRDGVIQTPTLLVGWSGDPRIPAPVDGPRQARLRERAALHQVTNDIKSLAVYGLSSAVLARVGRLIGEAYLNPLQTRAINEGGVLAGENVVVAAPTSSGKTLIGYLACLASHARRGRAVVLVPMKALAAEKSREFQTAFGDCGITAIRSFGGVDDDDPALRANHYDVAFLTYEKFLLLALTRPYILDAIQTLVLDETHLIGDKQRGKTVELLLTLIKRRGSQGRRIQLVCLSASLDETNGFESWLEAKLIREKEATRPVPLFEGVISPSGRYRFRHSVDGKEEMQQLFGAVSKRLANEFPDGVRMRVANEAIRAIIAGDQAERVLVFPWSKARTRELARLLGSDLGLAPASRALSAIEVEGSGRDDSTTTTELLARLKEGIGFHSADLDAAERTAVEDAFRGGELRLLVATSSLAMGINTPATSVVVVDHTRWTGALERFSVADYKNMIGRAGRIMADARAGRTFLCAADEGEADKLFKEYVLGKPEALKSRLARLRPADLTLALLILSGPTKEGELIATAGQTFDGFQHSRDARWRKERREAIRASLDELRRSGYVTLGGDGTIHLTDTGRVLGRSSVSAGSSVAVIDAARLIVAGGEALDTTALLALAQLTVELDDIWIDAREASRAKWEQITRSKFLAKRKTTGDLLVNENDAITALRFKRMYCAGRWTSGAPVMQIEREANGLVPEDREIGAGAVRQLASRLASIVGPLAKVLALSLPDHASDLRRAAVAIYARLELGVPTEAAVLARMRLGLRRGELRRLAELGRTDFMKLREALENGDADVIAVFGSKRARDLLSTMRGVGVQQGMRRIDREVTDQFRLFDDVAVIDVL